MKLSTVDYSQKITIPQTIRHQTFSTERKNKTPSIKNISKRNESAHHGQFHEYRKIKSKNDRADIFLQSNRPFSNFVCNQYLQSRTDKQLIDKQSSQNCQSINLILRSLQKSKNKTKESLGQKGVLQHNFVKLKKLKTNMQHYRNDKSKQVQCKESSISHASQQHIKKQEKYGKQSTMQLFRRLISKPFQQLYESPILKISSKAHNQHLKKQSESTIDHQTIQQKTHKKIKSTLQPDINRQTSSNSNRIVDHEKIKKQFRFKNIKVKRTLSNKNQAVYKNIQQNKQRQYLKAPPLLYFTKNQLSHIKSQSFIITQHPQKQTVVANFSRKMAEVASLTKIMTFYCILTIENQFNRNVNGENILIDNHIQSMSGTTAELCEGDIYTVKQLLYGMMLPSGNDAATALAKWGGTILLQNSQKNEQLSQKTKIGAFLEYMNKCAKKIGMKLSNFANPHGLPNSKSKSSPEEMALLIHQCLSYQLFLEVVSTKIFRCWTINQNIKRQIIWQNTNKLLRRDGFIGVKTGVTVTAGPCLATCYKSKDKIFIIVLLRASKLSRRFKQTRYILGMALNRLNKNLYQKEVKRLYYEDPQLDSDNSEDQQQFDYNRTDQGQILKRNKILTYEM